MYTMFLKTKAFPTRKTSAFSFIFLFDKNRLIANGYTKNPEGQPWGLIFRMVWGQGTV